MTAVGIIPARYGSTRFPGKPLVSIAGLPMVQRVWEGARAARQLRDVIVATDDARIAEACEKFGAHVAMTSSEHPSGTDRLAEVAHGLDDEIVVNIQGDEPLIEGRVVDAAVEALRSTPEAPMSTLVHTAAPAALDDPNRVKVVRDQQGFALYFSRSPIPARRSPDAAAPLWQHVGLYAYRRDFLLQIVTSPRTPLECAEELEQLRVLETGYRIVTAVIEDWDGLAVDVPDDVQRVEARLRDTGGQLRIPVQ